jgi:hypothetical protein
MRIVTFGRNDREVDHGEKVEEGEVEDQESEEGQEGRRGEEEKESCQEGRPEEEKGCQESEAEGGRARTSPRPRAGPSASPVHAVLDDAGRRNWNRLITRSQQEISAAALQRSDALAAAPTRRIAYS